MGLQRLRDSRDIHSGGSPGDRVFVLSALRIPERMATKAR